jgi:heme/copper-type cytochrome/quinol oxidase subunit 2
VVTNLLIIELAILIFVTGLVAIAAIAYRLSRGDIRKRDRLKWLTTLAKAVVAVFAAVMTGGVTILLARLFLHARPGG